MLGPALSLFRGRENCLDVKPVLRGFGFADATYFIDYGIAGHCYSPNNSSGVQITGHSDPCLRQAETSTLLMAALPAANQGRFETSAAQSSSTMDSTLIERICATSERMP